MKNFLEKVKSWFKDRALNSAAWEVRNWKKIYYTLPLLLASVGALTFQFYSRSLGGVLVGFGFGSMGYEELVRAVVRTDNFVEVQAEMYEVDERDLENKIKRGDSC